MSYISIMKIFLLCFAFSLSRVLCDHPMNVQVTVHPECIVSVSESSIKRFNESLEKGKKVVFFRIHYDSKQADVLTRPKPDDHFANPNEYMWLYDGEHGLPIYMKVPYDFDQFSMFILSEFTSTVTVDMKVTKYCNENIVSRVDFLRLVFRQLMQIVSTAHLPDKTASAYVCYDINNRKNLPDYSFLAYKRLGVNREVLQRYCCKVKNIAPNPNNTDLCPGHRISTAKTLDLQNYLGAFLFAFSPFSLWFIAWAKLPGYRSKFAYIHSVSKYFDKGEQFVPPFGTESNWISEYDDSYSIFAFLKWLFLFDHSSLFVSRIRRTLAVFVLFSTILPDLLGEYYFYRDKLEIYLADNIPIGYKSLMFGYEKSAENTDYIFGGPFVWFSSFVILGVILIIIPDRLCQTIAYSTLHQQETFTFLVQDIELLQRYGCLNVSNLHDHDLLHAILLSCVLTALNPSFWCAVIKRWFDRCKRVYDCFNHSRVIYHLIGLCVTFICLAIFFFFCVCELLLCILYYGCPELVLWKNVFHSYILCYIYPFYKHGNLSLKIFSLMLFLMFLITTFLLFYSCTYFFLTTYQLLTSYIMFTVLALIAKPDATSYVLLLSLFVYFTASLTKSVSETYKSLLRVSIKLADSVCKDFVYTRLEEHFIYDGLFQEIVERHHPIRYEVAKALMKLGLAIFFYTSCTYSFDGISLTLSTYIKIGLIILTSMIPKITAVITESVLDSRWKIERILETIYHYKLVSFDRQNHQ